MQPIEFFLEHIGQEIYRGKTPVKVTEENHKKLFELQDEKKNYLFYTTPLDK